LGQFIEDPKFTSFTFISDGLVLVLDIAGNGQVSLGILAVPPRYPVCNARSHGYLCELRYPRLSFGALVDDVLITSAPLTTLAVPDIPVAPFAHSSTDILFMVILKYIKDSGIETVVLLVPHSTILNHISSVILSLQKSLEWESWGPKGSCMLKVDPSDVWIYHSYGMKFVYSPDGGTFVHTFDLNPYATRKVINTASCPDLSWKAMLMETKIRRRHNLFDTDVVTSFPGREASIQLTPNNHGWESTMITEDYIVMVQVGKSAILAIPLVLMTLISQNVSLQYLPTWQCDNTFQATFLSWWGWMH